MKTKIVREPEYYMKKALLEAEKAFKEDEVPVGAVIVKDGEIIARAHNERENKQIAVWHAEILAIVRACRKLGSWRLDDCEMFVTLEPCAMCAGAIVNARIKKLWFGAKEPKGGAAESRFRLLADSGLNWSAESAGGICKEECSKPIKDFFAAKRGSNSSAAPF